MKQILIILGLFASVSTFAQSPRIKLNQITKDTVKGSVLISSPTDSGMVYSRDFYIAYGLTDTVLILYGDTLAATSGIISSVLSDGVTITGNGTSGNELKVDTSLIVTIKALNDSLATISASTTPDNVTITGDGSVGNPLKVDTATVISTIKGLVDTLTARGYLTANQTITLSGDVTGSGTTAITATVVDDSHNHIISNVDNLQDSLDAKANDSDLANYVTIAGAETITGAKTFTNTFTQSGGDANFDNNTLYVDESANSVGIGTSSVLNGFKMQVSGATSRLALLNTSASTSTNYSQIMFGHGTSGGQYADFVRFNNTKLFTIFNDGGDVLLSTNYSGGYRNDLFIEAANGNVGIGTSSPSAKLEVSGGDANFDNNTLFVDESANRVGIGTSSPNIKLTVQDTTTGASTLRLNNTSSGGALYMTKGATAIMFNGSADTWTGGGSTNDAALGAYQSNIKFFTNNSGTLKARLDASGNWDILGTTGSLSDIRSKKNIKYLNNSLQNVLMLKPIYYTSIYDTQEKEKIGFIAQDIQEIYPELVNDYGAENLLSLNYTGLIPVLTKAIQEQQAIIKTQQTEIDQLKTLITDLTNRLTILENK